MTWVQLLRIQQIEKRGISRTYHPGDWVEVGEQAARRWVIDGAARFAAPQPLAPLDGCGVVTLRGASAPEGIRTETADSPGLTFARTLILGDSVKLRPELLPVGFHLLSTWEVVCPLWDYDQLAIHVGSKEAKDRTERLIGDLRVPLYQSHLVWIRRCRAGEALVEAWNTERQTGDDDRHCFLRALWRVKPLICATPVTWHKSA